MRLLTVLAGHPILSAIDRDPDMGCHGSVSRSSAFAPHRGIRILHILSFQDRPNTSDSHLEPAADVAIGRLEATRMSCLGIKLGGKSRPIGPKRLQLRGELLFTSIALLP